MLQQNIHVSIISMLIHSQWALWVLFPSFSQWMNFIRYINLRLLIFYCKFIESLGKKMIIVYYKHWWVRSKITNSNHESNANDNETEQRTRYEANSNLRKKKKKTLSSFSTKTHHIFIIRNRLNISISVCMQQLFYMSFDWYDLSYMKGKKHE